MATPTLITGDDVAFAIRLTKQDKQTFPIDAGATLVARIVSTDRESAYTPELVQVTAHADADLPNSLVIIAFSSSDTIDILYQGSALIEVQVNDGGKLTWFTPVRLSRGQIA